MPSLDALDPLLSSTSPHRRHCSGRVATTNEQSLLLSASPHCRHCSRRVVVANEQRHALLCPIPRKHSWQLKRRRDSTTYSQFLKIFDRPPVGHDVTIMTSFDIPCSLFLYFFLKYIQNIFRNMSIIRNAFNIEIESLGV